MDSSEDPIEEMEPGDPLGTSTPKKKDISEKDKLATTYYMLV